MHKLGSPCVGIILAKGLNLGPLYLGAVLVEEPALGLGGFALFTNEARFSTLGVDTYVFGHVAVWTVCLFLHYAWHWLAANILVY